MVTINPSFIQKVSTESWGWEWDVGVQDGEGMLHVVKHEHTKQLSGSRKKKRTKPPDRFRRDEKGK